MRILLVDDHALVREGLASLIEPQPDMQVIGEAGSMQEAIAMTGDLQPDLVLMDITLPDGSGVEATRAILSKWPEMKIVCLTIHDDDSRLFEAIGAGAIGYLLKGIRSAELLDRLRGVARGEVALSPPTTRRILDEFSRIPASRPTQLTKREIEIVRELASGASNREIAERLVISENTVKNHVHNVLSKLQLRSRQAVADYARAHGLIRLPPESDE